MINTVDARGDECPIPVIKAKNAIEAMTGGTVEILVDNETAVSNLERMARTMNCEIETREEDGVFHVLITKDGEAAAAAPAPAEIVCDAPKKSGNTVVVISSDKMGSGDDTLGALLMKSFVFALTQLEKAPDTVLLYNGGAFVSTEGSPSIDNLKALEAAGTKIFTCGTCLNHYGIADKLMVGGVTNMYEITETLAKADRIIRP